MGRIAQAAREARGLVESLKAANRLAPGPIGAAGGTDRKTTLALGEIRRDTKRILREVRPSVADDRRLL